MDARAERTWQDVLKERYTTPQNEVLQPWVVESTSDPHSLPDNHYAALLEAPPGVDPRQDKATMAASMERVLDLLESVLDDDERAVIETTVIAGHSIRKAATILDWPPSTVHRIKQSALRRLKVFLTERET